MGMFHNLSKACKITRVNNAAAAAQTEIDSSIIDMAGFDGVLFLFLFNTIVDGSVVTCKAQQNTANSTSGMADITGASSGFTSASNSNTVLWVDVYRPSQEFVRAVVLRTTQNATLDGIIAIQYNGTKLPLSHDATTVLQGALAAF